jgi:hypothetical protein
MMQQWVKQANVELRGAGYLAGQDIHTSRWVVLRIWQKEFWRADEARLIRRIHIAIHETARNARCLHIRLK